MMEVNILIQCMNEGSSSIRVHGGSENHVRMSISFRKLSEFMSLVGTEI